MKFIAYNLNRRRIPLEEQVRRDMTVKKYDYYGATGVIDKVENYLFDETTILIAEDGANLLSRNLQLIYIATGKYYIFYEEDEKTKGITTIFPRYHQRDCVRRLIADVKQNGTEREKTI
ncbi:MAG: hypothetical protein KDK90_03700 [Leptospiraceae bacterium]|nr:hypothetical protein [Leptospiraceae bacterium]